MIADFSNRRPNVGRSLSLVTWATRQACQAGWAPNGISIAGLVFGLVSAGFCAAIAWAVVWATTPVWLVVLVIATIGFSQLRLVCNLLDGTVAQAANQSSASGQLWNEVPDRVCDLALFAAVGMAAGAAWLGVLVGALAIFGAYVREFARAATGAGDFSGVLSKPRRVHLVSVTLVLATILPMLVPSWFSAQTILLGGLIALAVGTTLTIAQRLTRLSANLKAIANAEAG